MTIGLAWIAAALALAIAELLVPGVFLIFLAIAAGIVGVATLVLPDLPIAAQLAAFTVWSIVTVVIGRRWYTDYPVETSDPLLNDRAARMVGQIVEVVEPIRDGVGRVRVGDGVWPARGPDTGAGVSMRIERVTDGALVVVPLESLR